MAPKKKTGSVIAVCIQEPFEDGSKMDFGLIKGDELRFFAQRFADLLGKPANWNRLRAGDMAIL